MTKKELLALKASNILRKKRIEELKKAPTQQLTNDPFSQLHGRLQNPSHAPLESKLKEMIFIQLKIAMNTGDIGSLESQILAHLHRQWLCLFWREGMYTKQSHLRLADIYTADPRFSAVYDKRVAMGATQFLRDAIEIYLFRGPAALPTLTEIQALQNNYNGKHLTS